MFQTVIQKVENLLKKTLEGLLLFVAIYLYWEQRQAKIWNFSLIIFLYTACAFKQWQSFVVGRSKSDVLNTKNKEEKTKKPLMDFVYLGFIDFLWAYTFIGNCTFLLGAKGTIALWVRKHLAKWNLIKIKECDYEVLAAKLCLEQASVINYQSQTEDRIATFTFAEFPYVDKDCQYQSADIFAVEIDLTTRRFVKAILDDLTLTAKEATILLWFNTIGPQHVKIHAMANWGFNPNADDEFLRRNGVATIMYNYYGYTRFNDFFQQWSKLGLASQGWADPRSPFVQSIDHSISENVVNHTHVKDLVNHSRFVKFVVLVRAIFHSEFKKYQHMFPGIDAEAMFVGTVLHSLDHVFSERNMEDPLWLDVEDPLFGKMAEVGRIARVGFTPDVPGVYFEKHFKGSGHPFYETVYRKAAKIDKELADHMDTCIIR
jgi:hypothetical protein